MCSNRWATLSSPNLQNAPNGMFSDRMHNESNYYFNYCFYQFGFIEIILFFLISERTVAQEVSLNVFTPEPTEFSL